MSLLVFSHDQYTHVLFHAINFLLLRRSAPNHRKKTRSEGMACILPLFGTPSQVRTAPACVSRRLAARSARLALPL